MQVPDAWPNTFRQSRFLSAVDFVQADRLRRKVALEMARVMAEVDLLLVPSLRDDMLTISNHTGHPSLTLRTGFVSVAEARSDWAPDPAQSAAALRPAARGAARRHADRPAVRRGHDRAGGHGDGACRGRRVAAAGRVLREASIVVRMTDLPQDAADAAWNGLALRVSARLVGRYAWQTASIELAIDDRVVLETGGVLKFVGAMTRAFDVEGVSHVAQVQWGRGLLKSFPYEVAIDGVEVRRGRVTIGNWWVGLWPWIPFAAFVLWASLR